MPTVDQLDPALAATDADELVASQSGILRRTTRAQLLAGTQPQITVAAGTLLGRHSAGAGAPEPIAVGAGLALSGATLSATPSPLVLAGLDVSTAVVIPSGASAGQPLAALLGATVAPESFGAVGDGVTDDTAALAAAIATLRPVRLGPRSYAITGQWTIATSATLLGTPGQTVLRRIGQRSGGAWISIQGPSFNAEGIAFDASGAQPGSSEAWAVLVTAACTSTRFRACVFRNAAGVTLGNGLTVLASDPAAASHDIEGCEAAGNAAHGIWLQAVDGARVANTHAHGNAGYGICADDNDATFRQAVRLARITGNTCDNNLRGISVGNYNATNLQPPTWGNANPDAIGAVIAGNVCHDNQIYGIAVSGRALLVHDNLLSANGNTANGGAGLLANASYSRVAGNVITGASQYGIDCGGSLVLDVSANHVSGAAVGINCGGGHTVRVTANVLQDNGWAIMAYNVETDGNGRNFNQSTSGLDICDNTIGLSSPTAGGIWLLDAPQQVLIAGNSLTGTGGATVTQCLYAHTDSAMVVANTWNNAQRLFANPAPVGDLQTVQVPDIADEAMLSVVPSEVQSIRTSRQLAVAGQIGFIKVGAPGAGYTQASVAVAGAGSGAIAVAYLSGGGVIGIALTNPGAGYAGGPVSVTISGDGTGAAATASVGLPLLEGRRIRLACNVTTRFARAGSAPFQDNWTLADLTVPANATIGFTAIFGTWRADSAPLADYLAPPGDGSLVVRTMPGGDLILRPAAAGHVRVATDADPTGYIATTGHGSPLGVVPAPPGSDYRNLDGGAGQTLWVKRSGTDAQGWFAVA